MLVHRGGEYGSTQADMVVLEWYLRALLLPGPHAEREWPYYELSKPPSPLPSDTAHPTRTCLLILLNSLSARGTKRAKRASIGACVGHSNRHSWQGSEEARWKKT